MAPVLGRTILGLKAPEAESRKIRWKSGRAAFHLKKLALPPYPILEPFMKWLLLNAKDYFPSAGSCAFTNFPSAFDQT